MSETDRYHWEHLVEHMMAAGRADDAETLASDERWMAARLRLFGPAAVAADLARVHAERTDALARAWNQSAHLFGTTVPAQAVESIVASRLGHVPGFHWPAMGPESRIVNRWPLPDLPSTQAKYTLVDPNGVDEVVIAPDDTWLATRGYRGVQVWDLATGTRRFTCRSSPDLDERGVAISPDLSFLATVASDGRLRIWDAATGSLQSTFESEITATSSKGLGISPDVAWLAAATHNSVEIWNLGSGRRMKRLPVRDASALAIEPHGSSLAVADWSRVHVWNPHTWERRVLDTQGAHRLTFGPDGSWLACIGIRGEIRIWDTASGELLGEAPELDGHTSRAVAISPNRKWIARGLLENSTVELCTLDSGETFAQLGGHIHGVDGVAISHSGAWVATIGRNESVRIWDAAVQPGVDTHPRSVEIAADVAAAADATWLASAGRDGSVRLWDRVSGLPSRTLAAPVVQRYHSLAPHPIVRGRDSSHIIDAYSGKIRIWNARGEMIKTIELRSPEWPFLDGVTVHSLAVAVDFSWIATGEHHTIRLWQVDTGKMMVRLEYDGGLVHAMVPAPDGTGLLAAYTTGVVARWDLKSASLVSLLGIPTYDTINDMASSPDGRWLVTASREGKLCIWDLRNDSLVRTTSAHPGGAESVDVSADGTLLISVGADATVKVWAFGSGDPLTMTRIEARAFACGFVGDTHDVLVAGYRGLYLFGIERDGIGVA
jgi:WD40 repeat protein